MLVTAPARGPRIGPPLLIDSGSWPAGPGGRDVPGVGQLPRHVAVQAEGDRDAEQHDDQGEPVRARIGRLPRTSRIGASASRTHRGVQARPTARPRRPTPTRRADRLRAGGRREGRRRRRRGGSRRRGRRRGRHGEGSGDDVGSGLAGGAVAGPPPAPRSVRRVGAAPIRGDAARRPHRWRLRRRCPEAHSGLPRPSGRTASVRAGWPADCARPGNGSRSPGLIGPPARLKPSSTTYPRHSAPPTPRAHITHPRRCPDSSTNTGEWAVCWTASVMGATASPPSLLVIRSGRSVGDRLPRPSVMTP